MTYDVQIIQAKISEKHVTDEMNKRAAEGWQVVSTACHDRFGLIITYARA